MSELRINISKLSEGTHQRSLQVSPQEIGLDDRFTREVKVEATMEKTSRQLILHVGISTGGKFTCDRCLEEFETGVSSSYDLVYVVGDQSAVRDEEDVQVIPPDANIIDLGEDVRQFSILALPPKMLCREDCAGLCTSCGANLNRETCSCRNEEIDPRWSGLQKTLKN